MTPSLVTVAPQPAYCCECGRLVPALGNGEAGHCKTHPTAKRTRKNLAKFWFDEMRRVVDAAQDVGRVFRSTGNDFWRMQEKGSGGGALYRIVRVGGAR